MELFPAVLVGGPPHSGKSVLTYSLSQALRRRGVAHYVLRAAPDGEGDWANEAAQKLVRTLRVKGDFTPAFVDHVCDSLARRHLPLLVDAGGRPTPEQERMFDYCTHVVLLARDEPGFADWRAIAGRQHLPIVAELTSRLSGESRLDVVPVLRGILTGLERGETASGPVFEALVARLAEVLYYDPAELRRIHDSLCPAETVIDLDRLAHTFKVPFEDEKAVWEPRHLPGILDYLPAGAPLGLYGRGPNWLYAALAFCPPPEPFYQFDPRLGWVTPPSLRLDRPAPDALLQAHVERRSDHTQIAFHIPGVYLDYDQAPDLRIPPPTPGLGVVLSGKLPLWLYTGLALTYRAAPWIAVYQPPLGCAVIVYSTDPARAVGDCIA
jgi:CRISPR-associated protein Csx3